MDRNKLNLLLVAILIGVKKRKFTVVTLCRDPFAEAFARQNLPEDIFAVKEAPSFDTDIFIVEDPLLTPTEQKILQALAKLGTIKAVAEHLHYCPSTVKRYLCRVYRKLKVKSAPQATALAVRLGLICPPLSQKVLKKMATMVALR